MSKADEIKAKYADMRSSSAQKRPIAADKSVKIDWSAERIVKPNFTGLKQIKDMGYADKFKKDSREVICIGVNYSSEARNIDTWLIK